MSRSWSYCVACEEMRPDDFIDPESCVCHACCTLDDCHDGPCEAPTPSAEGTPQ